MIVIPLLHTILIKPDHVEKTTKGGIYIPDVVTDKERKAVEVGTVVRVGPRAFIDYGRSPDILSAGDKVTYARYAGKEVRENDVIYLLVNDVDVLALLMETE